MLLLQREKHEKEGENKNTKWENGGEIGHMILNIRKQLLESGRNSAMKVAAWIVCNLLLKT